MYIKCTELKGEGGQTGDSTNNNRKAEGPPTAPPVHGWPKEKISRQFSDTSEQEVEIFIATQSGSVIRKPYVDASHGKPVMKKKKNKPR